MANDEQAEADDRRSGSDRERHAGAEAARQPPGHGAREEHDDVARQEVEHRLGRRRPEAVAARLRLLDELRDEEERPVHPDAEHHPCDVRRPDAAEPHHVHVDERGRHAVLEPDPGDEPDGGGGEEPEHTPGTPAPRDPLRDRDEQREQPAREEEGTGNVDAARVAGS